MLNFQDLIANLNKYWADKGCLIAQPMDLEVGAGTFHPLTFFRSLGDKPWRTGYVQASRRPTDGRYGDNPLRMQRYYQYQVIIKPAPRDIIQLYIDSLRHAGIDTEKHDLRFVEDDWESPTLGAAGLGWEVWLDSLEVTQFTYFQQLGGIGIQAIPAEITYGLERIAMFIQGKNNVFEIEWCPGVTYGDIHKADEKEFSEYNFEENTEKIKLLWGQFNTFEAEAGRLLDKGLLYPAYENTLKSSHIFNMLDAHGALSISERPAVIKRIRALAARCASLYLERGEK